jgi:hypothetical protein
MSHPQFLYTPGPESAEANTFYAGQWALRKYGFPAQPDRPAKSDLAMNPCQTGDEEDCAAWLRACLTEAYN